MSNREAAVPRDPNDGQSSPPITPREREVAELITEGLRNEEIAARLVLTPGTVANHVAHIMAKLGAQSRVQVAVRIASESRGTASADAVLELLQRLRQVDATPIRCALQHAADVLAESFKAEKVDAFFYYPASEMLVALGTSNTPLGHRQRELGLHELPLTHSGRVGWVFQQGRPFRDGHVDNDALELYAVRSHLGVRSTLAAPLEITPDERGVLLVQSTVPEHFTDAQCQLLQFVAYWVGLVAREFSSQHAEAPES